MALISERVPALLDALERLGQQPDCFDNSGIDCPVRASSSPAIEALVFSAAAPG